VTVYHNGTQTYTTDENGQVDLTGLKNGFYAIKVVDTDYGMAIDTITVENGICPDINIIPTEPVVPTCDANFSITAMPGPGGTDPLAGAVVILTNGSTTITGTTDEAGLVTIPGLSAGSYQYTISLDGYASVTGTYVVSAGPICPTESLTMEPVRTTCDATFIIPLPAVGTPAGGLITTVSFNGGDPVATDDQGHATITGISNGSYPYTVSVTGYPTTYTYSGTYTVTDLDCQEVLLCPAVFRMLEIKGTAIQNVTLHINDEVGLSSNSSGIIIAGLFPVGDYYYTASWMSETAAGHYIIPPDSETCPTTPYVIQLH